MPCWTSSAFGNTKPDDDVSSTKPKRLPRSCVRSTIPESRRTMISERELVLPWRTAVRITCAPKRSCVGVDRGSQPGHIDLGALERLQYTLVGGWNRAGVVQPAYRRGHPEQLGASLLGAT